MATNWLETDVKANDLNLHLYRTGGDNPPLLLAHGITDNGLCWARLAQALAADYDVIMLDARGHGLSEHATSYLPEDHVSDLVAVIGQLGLTKPALLGHSMGALNGAVLAANYPDLLSCLLLEDPPWSQTPQSIVRDEDTWRKNLAVGRTRTLEDLMATGELENPEWDKSIFPAWAEAKRQVAPEVVSWLDGGRSLNGWREVVAKITCPTLLITGDTDVRVEPETAVEAQALCQSLEHAHIENAGHSIRRDQFKLYLNSVKSFLLKHYAS